MASRDKRTQASGAAESQPQDTGKFRTNTKDQFYTKETVAKECVDQIIALVPYAHQCVWVEPSAGSGAFLHNVPPSVDKIGIDIDPRASDIAEQDFFNWSPPPSNAEFIVFGNPPFGRQSSLAKLFISKSCTFARVVAFILPKSFTKPSMFNVFPTKFHCIYSEDLVENSFSINGTPHDVPCVFQVWEKQETDRGVAKKTEPTGFQYVKKKDMYDLAFRRVGVKAGQCYRRSHDTARLPEPSYNFIKFNDELVAHIDQIIYTINQHTFPSNTTCARSLSKSEINEVINAVIASL